MLIADFRTRMLLPAGDGADMTYYKPRSKDELLPLVGGRASKGARDTPFQEEWNPRPARAT